MYRLFLLLTLNIYDFILHILLVTALVWNNANLAGEMCRINYKFFGVNIWNISVHLILRERVLRGGMVGGFGGLEKKFCCRNANKTKVGFDLVIWGF